MRAILDAADDRFVVLFALGAFAGLRLGEGAGVQVGDVDFLHRSLRVRRQVQRAGQGTVEVRPPKYRSERVVYLPDELLAQFALHIQRSVSDEPDAWLFAPAGGNPPRQNTVGHQWREPAGERESAA